MFNPLSITQVDCQSKIVQYFGYKLEAPIWTKYLATDLDGSVYAYKIAPIIFPKQWDQTDADEIHPVSITTITYDGDWKESLVMVE